MNEFRREVCPTHMLNEDQHPNQNSISITFSTSVLVNRVGLEFVRVIHRCRRLFRPTMAEAHVIALFLQVIYY